MTREEYLAYCKVCNNKEFSPQKGIICSLTKDVAAFEDDCVNFNGNRQDIQKLQGKKSKELKKREWPGFIKIFVPSSSFFAIPVIGAVNILVFIIMVCFGVHAINPDIEQLITWGANYKVETLEGGYWRLLSNIFIHIGIIHLLVNLYALLYVGVFLEPVIGKGRVILTYLIAGFSGSLLSLVWYDNVVSAGASGAIFGLYGVYLVLLLSAIEHKKMNKAALPSIILFVVYTLLYGMQEGIDNAAHIGGFFSGILFGLAFIPVFKGTVQGIRKYAFTVALSVVIIFSGFLVVFNMPNTLGEYDAIMNEYSKYEQRGLEVFNPTGYQSDEEIKHTILSKSIPAFHAAEKTLDKIKNIEKLPFWLKQRTDLMKDYTRLHIKHLQLIVSKIDSQNTTYDYLIEETWQRIASVFQELTGKTLPVNAMNKPSDRRPNERSDNFARKEVKNQKPLYVVNGKPVGNTLDLEPQEIKSLTVLSDSAAINNYGDKGRGGVILVTTE